MIIKNLRVRLWIYNNIKRPLANRRLRRMWIREGRPPEKFIGVGRLDAEAMAWGAREAARVVAMTPEERAEMIATAKTWEQFKADFKRRSR